MKKTAMNMTKKQIVNLIKTANHDSIVTTNNSVKELNSTVNTESVYPLTVEGFDGLNTAQSDIVLMVSKMGLKMFRPKTGGFVGKQGRTRVIEFYLCDDERVHIYTAPERIEKIIKAGYKGIKTTNDKWSISNTRYEMGRDFYRFAYDYLYNGFEF